MVLAATFDKTAGQKPSDWVPIKEKNRLNNLSEDYWKTIQKRYLKYFDQVKNFLGNPLNESILEMYEGAVDEFERQIVAHKRHNDGYEIALETLIKYLLNRDSILRKNKMVTTVVVYYMYWNCDLGKKNP